MIPTTITVAAVDNLQVGPPDQETEDPNEEVESVKTLRSKVAQFGH